tara:strand:+ start:753 stop:941 length:189 start_codon:yes stop_codon:yes gene_type:complete
MIFFRTLIPFVLGIFGIREFTKEEGVIDRAIDSPIGRIGYITIVALIFFAIFNAVKDLKLFR